MTDFSQGRATRAHCWLVFAGRRFFSVRLSSGPRSLEAMGKSARAMLDAHFSRRHAFGRWVDVLRRLDPTSENKFATTALRTSLEPPSSEQPVVRTRLSA